MGGKVFSTSSVRISEHLYGKINVNFYLISCTKWIICLNISAKTIKHFKETNYVLYYLTKQKFKIWISKI